MFPLLGEMWESMARMSEAVARLNQQPQKKMILKKGMFPELNFGDYKRTSLVEFMEWRKNVDLVFHKFPSLYEHGLTEILAALIDDMGEGRKSALNQFPLINGQFKVQHIEEFFEELKFLACGPAVDTLAEAEFEKFVMDTPQPKNAALKLKLTWECAFPPHQRSYQTLMNKFMKILPNGLSDKLIKDYFPTRGYPDHSEAGFEAVVDWCEEIESNRKLAATMRNIKDTDDNRRKKKQQSTGGTNNANRNESTVSTLNEGTAKNQDNKSKPNPRRNKFDRAANTAKSFGLSEEKKKQLMEIGACFVCQKQGHLSRNCPEKTKTMKTMNNLEDCASEEEGEPAGEFESAGDQEENASMSRLANATTWFNLSSMNCLQTMERGRDQKRSTDTKNDVGRPHLRHGGRPLF